MSAGGVGGSLCAFSLSASVPKKFRRGESAAILVPRLALAYVFVGEIIEVSKEVWYKIKYSDGDSEEVSREVALRGIRRYELEEGS